MTAEIVTAKFPKAFKFLFEPMRYKGIRGGRGKAASWSVARALLILGCGDVPGYQRPLRILCARETQKSIKDSVHTLLKDQIRDLGLQSLYVVQESEIQGPNGTSFIFAGLKHNITNIKSVEGCDIVWIEEAQTVSKVSWDTLIPTIRKEASEIWITWNDILETDETHQRFVLHPPSNSIIKKLTYRDNPYFPEVLRIEMEDLKARDEESYRHVWEGECRSAVEGAIYGAEIKVATAEGRIGNVPVDRSKPIDTIWDLGYEDQCAIWFIQPYGGWWNFVDYLEDSQRTIDWYAVRLQQRGYVYGTHWVPHDAVDTLVHHKLGGGDKTKSIEMIMRDLGLKVRIAPKLAVHARINAGRMLFPQCRFDQDRCSEGLRALRMYQWGPPPKSGQLRREPLHDAASHGADAYQVAAVAVKQPKREDEKKPQGPPPAPPRLPGPYSPFG